MEISSNSYGIGVDIGTSTIGMALIHIEEKKIIGETGFLNPQKQHGSDVAARIRYGSDVEGARHLGQLIKKELLVGVGQLLKDTQYSIKEIVISANTAMEYLFLERTTETLGAYPFHMENVGYRKLAFQEVFENFFDDEEIANVIPYVKDSSIILLPCISTFVGGDITSGLYHLQFPKTEGCHLLLDLGTNGEMAISGEKGFYCTSVPAGPAFEASLRGQGRKGTALIEWMAIARCRGQIMVDGAVARRYEETGIPLEENLVLTQKVLRKIQLAKGALMAGIELLMKQYGASSEEVQKVYLAGSFGFHLDVKSATLLGMLPANFQGKIEVVGNTSLKGAIDCLCDVGSKDKMEQIIKEVQPFNLAETDEFRELFLERMKFMTIRI